MGFHNEKHDIFRNDDMPHSTQNRQQHPTALSAAVDGREQEFCHFWYKPYLQTKVRNRWPLPFPAKKAFTSVSIHLLGLTVAIHEDVLRGIEPDVGELENLLQQRLDSEQVEKIL